jgi:hypothetical protein
MTLSIIPVNQVFGKYDQQTRMGEVNRKNPIRTIQSQVDRVTISPEALKKRAIGAALAAIQSSNQISAEASPVVAKNAEPVSYADKVVHNALEKSREAQLKDQENIQNQADSVRKKFLQKTVEFKEKAAAELATKKKAELEKEVTPF